jgi:hypothetical protein
MTQAHLNALERDVEQARARFASDLARLKSPETLSAFKADLWSVADETKDDLVAKAKEAATDGVERIVADLKHRVRANPAAVLAIGAGLAWRIARRPPIASLLVGMGLLSLWRTRPDDEDILSRASELAGSVKETVLEWSEDAVHAGTQLADKAISTAARASDAGREAVMQLKENAGLAADRASSAAQETVAQIKERVAAAGDRASVTLHQVAPDAEARDRLLFGAAALAVATAVGIAYQRRVPEPGDGFAR